MERKIHDTIKERIFKYAPVEVKIKVINTTELEFDVDIIHDIDEYKVFINKKED